MLIVSQDRKGVINLDRVDEIIVYDFNTKNPIVRAFFRIEDYFDIAQYESDERAIQVLADLAAAYEHGAKVFEMPKE